MQVSNNEFARSVNVIGRFTINIKVSKFDNVVAGRTSTGVNGNWLLK